MKPNLIVPLALSYDQRFPLGNTGVQAGYDQRKVNACYETVQNPLTGKTTLVLAKRPGATASSNVNYGSDTQVVWLVERVNASAGVPCLIVRDSNDTKSEYNGNTKTILSSADYVPAYSSQTVISGTPTYIVQLRDDDSGVGAQKVYWSADLTGAWTEITDADFTAIDKRGKVAYLDGTMYIAGAHGIYGSDLNSVTAWTATNLISKSTEQDYTLGIIPFGDQILLFGERYCEKFHNAGNATGSLLSRIPGSIERVGLGRSMFEANTTEYYCSVGKRLYFLGNMTGSYGGISLIAYDGVRFERVSGQAEDRIMSEANVYGLFPFAHHTEHAIAITLTPPGTTPARWLMFYPDTKSWFEWTSTVIVPMNSGAIYGGLGVPDTLYNFASANKWQDDATSYEFLTQFRLPFDDDERHFMYRCGVQADTVSTTLTVKFNDTGAATYGTGRTLDLSQPRKIMHRCGTFRERYVQLSNTSDKQIRLRNFYADIQ